MQIKLITRQQAMDLVTDIFRQLANDAAADVVITLSDATSATLPDDWCTECNLPAEICRCEDIMPGAVKVWSDDD